MSGSRWPGTPNPSRYPNAGRQYVKKHGKYRDASWRHETRDRRRRIDPAAFTFAERRMRGKLRNSDPNTIQDWLWQDGQTLELQSNGYFNMYVRNFASRAEGSPFFRNVVWPPQDKHDRVVYIPSPSTSLNAYSLPGWTYLQDKTLFEHVFLYGRSVACAAKRMGKSEGDCIERYREIFHLPLNREHRLRLEWTVDEDRELLSWVDDLGKRDWIRISHFVRHHQETCKFRYRELRGDGFNTEIMDDDEADYPRLLPRPFTAYPDSNTAQQEGVGKGEASSDNEANPLDLGQTNQDEVDNVDTRRTSNPKHEAPVNGKRLLNEEDYGYSSDEEKRSVSAESPAKRTRISSNEER